MEEKETNVYLYSELLAFVISKFLYETKDNTITFDLLYSLIKEYVKDESIIEQVYEEVKKLLADKYKIDIKPNKDI